MKKLKATFIGKNGSMGLVNGMEYNISLTEGTFVHVHVKVYTSHSVKGISCPYQTIVKFLDNWDKIYHVK